MVLLRGSTTLQTSSFTSTVTLCFPSDVLQNVEQQYQPREWEQLGSGPQHQVHERSIERTAVWGVGMPASYIFTRSTAVVVPTALCIQIEITE